MSSNTTPIRKVLVGLLVILSILAFYYTGSSL